MRGVTEFVEQRTWKAGAVFLKVAVKSISGGGVHRTKCYCAPTLDEVLLYTLFGFGMNDRSIDPPF